jgi:hypothetical protein
MICEVHISVLEEDSCMDDLLAQDGTEEEDDALNRFTKETLHMLASCLWIEDGDINIGVGI